MKKLTLKLFSFLIPLVFVFPLFKESFSSFVIILICLNTIVYKISTKDYSFIDYKTALLTIPFWIVALNCVFTSDFDNGFPHINQALFFLIIPILFALIPKEFFMLKKINQYIAVLKITCLLIAIIYVFSFFIQHSSATFFVVFQNVSSFRNYIYYDFTLFIIHPTYYTTLLVLCAAHSFDLVLKQKKYSELLFIISFLLISFLLLTRLNIVVLVIVLMGMLLFRGNLSKTKRLFSIGTTLLFVTLLTVLTPGIKHRFVELYNSYNKPPVNRSYDSTNIRRAIFDCSVVISKENLIFGVGFGNLQTKLNDCYKSNYDSSFYENHNYMTHNYYNYILVSSGLLGFFFFLIYLATIIRIAIKTNLFLFYVFLFNALIVCLIEDYLFRQFGCLYFNVMLMCFIQYTKNNPASG